MSSGEADSLKVNFEDLIQKWLQDSKNVKRDAKERSQKQKKRPVK